MTVLPPDPYKILGVLKDAQISEIRSAYRKLVLKCHPDKIQDPALKEAKQTEFQQVQQAYELLSNDFEREKYDYKAELFERELRARSTTKTSASAPKEPVHYNVKDASPRASTFTSTRPGPYSGGAPSRSWEDTTAGARLYEEPPRSARKTASYEKDKPAKRDEERRRRKEEDDWAYKEKERTKEREAKEAARKKERKEEKERERLAREREDREKEKRKEEKKKAAATSDREKERVKERKSTTAEKHHSKSTRAIPDPSDLSDSSDNDVTHEPAPSKAERKKSSNGHKAEEVEPTLTSERTRKYSGNMESAIRYLTRSGAKPPGLPGFTRAQTFTEGSSKAYPTNPMVPTPPPAANAPFSPPPTLAKEPEELSDDDVARRSAARPSRRMSHDTPRSSNEKTSHKKSSTSREPVIIDAGSPRATHPSMSRAQTENFASSRPIAIPGMPGLARAETWYAPTDRERERRERSRSRQTPPNLSGDDDSDNDRERRRRRGRRTGSPEPMVSQVRYAVDGAKSYPIRQKSYHEQPTRNSYKAKGGSAYVVPNSSAPRQQRHATYAARGYYDEAERAQQQFTNVKYAPQYDTNDIKYSYRSENLYT